MNKKPFLEPYIQGGNNRYDCPKCRKKKEFARYIDAETYEYISNEVGRCNNQLSCGYHYTPKQFFSENKDFIFDKTINEKRKTKVENELSKPKGYHSFEWVKKSLSNQSNFVQFLYSNFDKNKVDEVVQLYYLGVSKHFNGNSVIFWQIDKNNRVHIGKVMQYDKSTGKRIKTPYSQITNVHSIIKDNTAKYTQHLFGEHLINVHSNKTILIVESEKTAVIGSIVMPQYNWIACSGLGNLNPDRLKDIIHYRKDNKLKLVPDLNAVDKWIEKGKELDIPVLKSFTAFATDDDIKNGLDIADLILRLK